MKFEVIGLDGKTKMSTYDANCVYSVEQLKSLSDGGYTFRLGGTKTKVGEIKTMEEVIRVYGKCKSEIESDTEVIESISVEGSLKGLVEAHSAKIEECSEDNVFGKEITVEIVGDDKPEDNAGVSINSVGGTCTVVFKLCKRAKKYDDVETKTKQFDDYDSAYAFILDKANKAKNYWGGGTITSDTTGEVVYESLVEA